MSLVASNRTRPRTPPVAALALLWALAPAQPAPAGVLDLCGCAGSPASLGEFRSALAETYPPGTTRVGTTITIPLPADGRLVFDSFALNGIPGDPSAGVLIRFTANQANDPVRILVAGDVTIPLGSTIDVSGEGAPFNFNEPRGGLGGPGGYRGGDGGNESVTLARAGGHGLGPGGGEPGVANASDQSQNGHNGTFVGNAELIPLTGGSGGGGGSTDSPGSAAGGGGGGGGAILIVANGTLTVEGTVSSFGGSGACLSGITFCGGTGSGGAIRLVAEVIAGSGTLRVDSAQPGMIRLEGFTISPSLQLLPTHTRSFAPQVEGSVPVPMLAITTVNGVAQSRVNGAPLAERPQGNFGAVDVIVDGGNPVAIGLASEGLAGGTSVAVSAKRRIGGDRITATAMLGQCDGAGRCTATATFDDLPSGTYFIEAKAAFN